MKKKKALQFDTPNQIHRQAGLKKLERWQRMEKGDVNALFEIMRVCKVNCVN